MPPTRKQSLTGNQLLPLFLFLGAFTAYIWAAPLRDLYGLEARNGLFIKTMVTDGPGLIPSVMGTPYLDYPPLYFWLSWLFSLPAGQVTTVSAVLPSALAGAAMVGITYLLARKYSALTAIIAALALATCPDYWLKAGRATIDMLLACWVSLAVFFLYLRHERSAAGGGIAAEIAAFAMMLLAFFTKGPVGLVLPVGIWSSFLICERRWRSLLAFALKSLLLAAASIGIELLFLWEAGGKELVRKVFEAQLAGRVGDETNEPVYYYLLYLLSGAAPWWIPAGIGVLRAGRRGGPAGTIRTFMSDFFSHETMRLAACWFFFVLALFTAASSRHNRYLLPLFPALFLLIGRGMELFLEQGSPQRRQGIAAFFKYVFFLIVAAGTVLFAAAPLSYRPPFLFWLAWAVCSILIYAALTVKKGGDFQALHLALLCVGCAMTAEAVLVEPWISSQESGRLFVRETEAKIDHAIPVVLYRINPDGDAVKYALYSDRRSATLSFAGTVTEVNNLPLPVVLVAFAKSEHELATLGAEKTMKEISQGVLHKTKIKSWLIQDTIQNTRPDQKPGGPPRAGATEIMQ